MAKEIKDVQQLINEKADLRLEKDIRELINSIYSGKYYELLKGLTVNVGTAEKPKVIQLYSIFSSDGYSEKIMEANREKYRSAEAANFIARVESIREDVDNLMSVSQQQDY